MKKKGIKCVTQIDLSYCQLVFTMCSSLESGERSSSFLLRKESQSRHSHLRNTVHSHELQCLHDFDSIHEAGCNNRATILRMVFVTIKHNYNIIILQ